jgi:hypothetical protein
MQGNESKSQGDVKELIVRSVFRKHPTVLGTIAATGISFGEFITSSRLIISDTPTEEEKKATGEKQFKLIKEHMTKKYPDTKFKFTHAYAR